MPDVSISNTLATNSEVAGSTGMAKAKLHSNLDMKWTEGDTMVLFIVSGLGIRAICTTSPVFSCSGGASPCWKGTDVLV